MQLGISDDIISFPLACGRPLDAALFAADIEDISPSNLHFLVLVILKLQPVNIFLRSFHLGSVECGCFGISSEHLLSDGKIGQRSIGPRDCDQRGGRRLVDLTRSTIFIRFRVLNLVSDLLLAQEQTPSNVKFHQTYRFLFATSEIEVMLHCIH